MRGSLEADIVTVKGRAEVHGPLTAGRLKIEGSAYVRNMVKADNVIVKGELRTLEGISSETFMGMGRFTIEGLLNAEKIMIEAYSNCRVDELGGREINVEKSINAILESAFTGESGDGRIFVSEVEQSIRIRTKDKGDESLYNK